MAGRNPEQKMVDSGVLEIEPGDTYNGYQVIKRGPVQINRALLGSLYETRQLVLCGNQLLLILRTPSQLIESLSVQQMESLYEQNHPFLREHAHLLHDG